MEVPENLPFASGAPSWVHTSSIAWYSPLTLNSNTATPSRSIAFFCPGANSPTAATLTHSAMASLSFVLVYTWVGYPAGQKRGPSWPAAASVPLRRLLDGDSHQVAPFRPRAVIIAHMRIP